MRKKHIEEHTDQGVGRGISIRWKLAFYMSAFVACVLIITWIFQVFLLDGFFRYVKYKELVETSESLAEILSDEDALRETAYKKARQHSMCVVVYGISEQTASNRLVEVDATGNNVILTLHPVQLEYFYQKASANDGVYFSSTVGTGGFEMPNGSGFFGRLPFRGDASKQVIENRNLRMMYVQLIDTEDDGNADYMILLDTHHQPLNSTVRTLTTQYVWIAVIILLLAAVSVLLLYRKISAPLIRMTESAKLLARGNYDVEFAGQEYLETHELADTLNYAAGELSKLDRLQKELLANISHDLRTPLTMIKGYGEVMRDLPGENTPENIQVIIDETARLSDLVNDLLDLSRLQANMRQPKMECFNLTLALKEVLQRYDALVKHRGYRVELFADGRDVWVLADRQMILQVLYNLINNAVNYTGEDCLVTVKQTVADGRVRISVTDTGEGIAPEEMPLIWDRYYKVDRVHRRAMIGTGLGLSIVKTILELHHAQYGVESKLSEGSTFWFEMGVLSLPGVDLLPSADNMEE